MSIFLLVPAEIWNFRCMKFGYKKIFSITLKALQWSERLELSKLFSLVVCFSRRKTKLQNKQSILTASAIKVRSNKKPTTLTTPNLKPRRHHRTTSPHFIWISFSHHFPHWIEFCVVESAFKLKRTRNFNRKSLSISRT